MASLRRLVLIVLVCACPASAAAQDERRLFVGVLTGVSALSADSRAIAGPSGVQVSLYTPQNGLALNAFLGMHVAEYFSVQANYVWNRNELTLVAADTGTGGAFYEQRRDSGQHAVVADGLVYFRGRGSRVRPYLGTGLSIVRFTSSALSAASSGLNPPGGIASTGVALRSHVGIDFGLSPRLAFRYSFSETIGGNPIGAALTPQGRRGLANFQNLFGVVARF